MRKLFAGYTSAGVVVVILMRRGEIFLTGEKR
jgi:hypothetical protein